MKVQEPIVMVGDLHGQYYDLNHMLEKAGHPPNINYLFLGDYVDRGIFGFEVTLLLFAIKVTTLITSSAQLP
jgi:serine/threonine-protein phosphatase 2B catalytic subunit